MLSPELNNKYIQLQFILHELNSVVIGYSGGVDSSLLLKVAVDTLGKNVLAVIGKSEIYPEREYKEAERFVKSFGISYRVVYTKEINDLKFRSNPIDRCYYCKTELFSKLAEIAKEMNIKWICDGSNIDDQKDFRPGFKAVKEKNVRSPLVEAEFTKLDIRNLSQQLNLPTWNKQSFACLASRFPYGFEIDMKKLKKIDKAETLLYNKGFEYFRVRHHDENTVRIEVGKNEITRFFDDSLRTLIVKEIKKLGFKYVALDLEGYRTGSMNEVLSEEQKLF